MLLKRPVFDGIASGAISLVFRRWRKPTVKSGGTLRTAIGILSIGSITTVQESALSTREAKRAGYATVEALMADLAIRRDGTLYRIEVRYAGLDPRLKLRARKRITRTEQADLLARLARLDRRSPWTRRVLVLIAQNPGRRAADLAPLAGLETADFKVNVRKLKALGLTESLEVGYRLSPRGSAFLSADKPAVTPRLSR